MTHNLTEQEQLDEAIFGGAGILLLGKLFMILSNRSNIEKVLDALKTRAKELPPEVMTLISATEKGLDIIEESLPPAVDSLTDKNGKWNPSNWATNIFVTILSKVIKKDKAEAPQTANPEATAAPVQGSPSLAEHTVLNQIRKLVMEELEVVLTNEEASEIFDISMSELLQEEEEDEPGYEKPLEAGLAEEDDSFSKAGKEIEKKGTEGVFTAKAKKAGMGVQGYADKVLQKGSDASTKTKRQAAFAKGAATVARENK